MLWKSPCCAHPWSVTRENSQARWVLQGHAKGQKPLLRSEGSEEGHRAGDRGKQKREQEEQRKQRLYEVKQSRRKKEMRRRERG